MEIIVTLPIEDLTPRERVRLARGYLVGLVATNEVLIAKGLVPPVYESGVTYRREPPGREEFADALTCLRRGWGDCDDLAAWRAAELLRQGVPATLTFRARRKAPRSNRYLVHVRVRTPWGIEDPSKKLSIRS